MLYQNLHEYQEYKIKLIISIKLSLIKGKMIITLKV